MVARYRRRFVGGLLFRFVLLAVEINTHVVIRYDEEFIADASFIDKSEWLLKFFEEVGHDFYAAPAQYGRTSIIKMVEKFAQYQWSGNGEPAPYTETHAYAIFKYLKISNYENFMKEHMARHPVISLDFNFENAGCRLAEKFMASVNSQLGHCFLEHQHKLETYYGESKVESELQKWVKRTLTLGMKEYDLGTNLQYLIEAMNECFDSNVILLIDGFDDFMHRDCDPIEKIFYVYDTFYTMLRNVFESWCSANVHVFVSTTTTTVFSYYGLNQYMQVYYFLEGNKYSPFFGFHEDELRKLFVRYQSNATERQHVAKYFNGYRINDRAYYCPFSITEYFRKRGHRKPRVPATSFTRPKNPCKFIWRFLKHPKYLNTIAKMVKGVLVRGEFKNRYEPRAFNLFIDFARNDFNDTESSNPNLLFTMSIEHGIFAPVAQNGYAIANYFMSTSIIRHLRYYYKVFLGINVVRIGFLFCQIFASVREEQAKMELQKSLSEAFAKLKVLNESSMVFTYNSLIHTACYSNDSVVVVEDTAGVAFSYGVGERNVAERCVTVIRSRVTNAALVIKVTAGESATAALEKAFQYYGDEGAKTVKYVGIDVSSQGSVTMMIERLDEVRIELAKKRAVL